MYIAGNLLALPLSFYGYGSFPQTMTTLIYLSIGVTFLPVAVLLAPGMGLWFPLDGPSWTIQSLLFMWALFPWLLSGVRRLSDAALIKRIGWCYGIQFFLVFALFYPLEPVLGYWSAFATSTWQPFSRLPVFMMGMYAAVLCQRYPQAEEGMPWPSGLSLGMCSSCRCSPSEVKGSQAWAKIADRTSLALLLGTLTVGAVDTFIRYGLHATSIGGGLWLQALVAGEQLTVVVALTRDGGQSTASAALRTPFAQWLGKISMALYLVHLPLFGYLAWAVHGGVNVAPQDPCPGSPGDAEYEACTQAMNQWLANQSIPMWGVALILPLATAIAVACYHLIEEPGRKLLRSRGKESSSDGGGTLSRTHVHRGGDVESNRDQKDALLSSDGLQQM
jgi:peptidoglycan/LPS O-acetylase OafA/YrhL